MKTIAKISIVRQLGITVVFLFYGLLSHGQDKNPLRVWYEKPARQWEECIPLGNGRLGAMPDGGVFRENIVLNDITLWSGGKQDADAVEAAKFLPDIQRLLLEGKNDQAEALMYKSFVCKGPGSGQGSGAKFPYGSYEVLGNLHIDYTYAADTAKTKPTRYVRELSLQDAVARTSFTMAGTAYTREYFTDFKNDVIIIRLTASKQKKLAIALTLDRPERFTTVFLNEELQMTGQLENGTDGKGMKYMTRVKVKTDGGTQSQTENTLRVNGANSITIYVSTATDFREQDFQKISADHLASGLREEYTAAKTAHSARYHDLFGRVGLRLGEDGKESIATDKRLEAFAEDAHDPALAALYFQFGRYLLISSTRQGLLPPNLQGLWANTIQTPWNGDYHLNINIQMNHWPLHVANLATLNEPFYDLVADLVVPGGRTAQVYYQADGWVAHTITNVWGYTSPGEYPSWGAFNTGSAWLCQMLWTHYEFTKDKTYLRALYRILKSSAEFYLPTMITDPATGWLMTSPSNSPENAFRLPSGKTASICMGPTIDNQIIRALFTEVIEAGTTLNEDAAFRTRVENARAKLPPNQIGKDGRLMEWLTEYQEVEPDHRHISHLWGLYPGAEITLENTPALATAARASLLGRGDGGTGWSLAWKINLWARLQDGEHAHLLLKRFLRPTLKQGFDLHEGGTFPNLFCAHPPFQIDGNFGVTAGIAEMLVQSHNGYIEFLPALPKKWSTGSFNGLCVRGGGEVDADWDHSVLKKFTLRATNTALFKIKVSAERKIVVKKNGIPLSVSPANQLLTLSLAKGDNVHVVFL